MNKSSYQIWKERIITDLGSEEAFKEFQKKRMSELGKRSAVGNDSRKRSAQTMLEKNPNHFKEIAKNSWKNRKA